MSPESRVQGPKSPGASGQWAVDRGGWQPASSGGSHTSRPPALPRFRAFTLIEIMIVVAIMGIVMTMSVPLVYKVWRKAPLRTAVKDVVEVCSHARARAIMSGKVTEVIFHPKDNRLEVAGAVSAPPDAGQAASAAAFGAEASSGSGLAAQLPSQVIIETLDINMSGVEYNDAEEAKIRFYPNGISDEMHMILFDGRDRMGIELEVTTGLATVVPDPLREWARK
jgi:prepilin-type N-terminal cleavage/methylation domain-containing protein